MKTPKKIKKALNVCKGSACVGDFCPYADGGGCSIHLPEDALEYIEQLEERIAILEEGQKHGKLTTKITQKHDGEWYCTVCDYEPIVMTDDMKYCPNCSAKMDGGDQDEAD